MRSCKSNQAWLAVFLLCGLNIFSFVDRLILGSIVEPIRRSLGIGDGEIGLLIGPAFVATYVVSSIVLARIADSGDRRFLIAACALGWGLATFGSGFAPTFWALLILRLVVGFSESGLMPAGVSIISDMFSPTARGASLGIYITAGILGASGASLFGAIAIHSADGVKSLFPIALASIEPWRLVFLALGSVTVLIALLFMFCIREPERLGAQTSQGFSIREVVSELRSNFAAYLGIFVGIALFQALCYGVLSWYPTFLARSFGLSIGDAAFGFGIIGIIGGPAGAMCASFLTSRLTRHNRYDAAAWIGALFMLASGPLLYFAALASTAQWSLVIMTPGIFFLIGSGAIPPLAAQALAPNRMRAQMTALYTTLSNVLGLALGPPMVALFAGYLPESHRPLGVAMIILYSLLLPLCLAALVIARNGLRRMAIRPIVPTG